MKVKESFHQGKLLYFQDNYEKNVSHVSYVATKNFLVFRHLLNLTKYSVLTIVVKTEWTNP